MRLQTIGLVVTLALIRLLVPLVAKAQQATKARRVGFLASASPSVVSHRIEAFRQGLRELGYVEGKNIAIEYRYAEGKLDRVPALVAELVGLRVEILVSGGPIPTRAAKQANVAIPIVMTQDTDPVGNGFVASLARPGGNITGLSQLAPELNGKRLELLNEIIPKLSRVAVFGRPSQPVNAQISREIELAAGTLGVKLQYLDVRSPKDIDLAFRAATKGRADAALMLVGGPVFNPNRTQILEFAVKSRLPMIYRNREDVEAGGLMSYGVNMLDLDRRAATYVDKILKGTEPTDIPVEQPTKFEFIINLKAAKQIGLIIPPNVVARADRVIR